ncbi:unnamed protein product [Protopolystoma xenopodis]|uniref:Uncharacterized protein n=1 Tax=Protopolystoma xenopodis TaxID=117903 RepID=A0A448WK55_9PLAT|nr:unnamed protein product [Protopolystoma xenopodis]
MLYFHRFLGAVKILCSPTYNGAHVYSLTHEESCLFTCELTSLLQTPQAYCPYCPDSQGLERLRHRTPLSSPLDAWQIPDFFRHLSNQPQNTVSTAYGPLGEDYQASILPNGFHGAWTSDRCESGPHDTYVTRTLLLKATVGPDTAQPSWQVSAELPSEYAVDRNNLSSPATSSYSYSASHGHLSSSSIMTKNHSDQPVIGQVNRPLQADYVSSSEQKDSTSHLIKASDHPNAGFKLKPRQQTHLLRMGIPAGWQLRHTVYHDISCLLPKYSIDVEGVYELRADGLFVSDPMTIEARFDSKS